MDISQGIAILVASLIGLALFTAAEAAVVGANHIRLRHLAMEGNRRAQAVVRLWERRDRFLATVIMLQNLFTIVASAVGTVIAVDMVGAEGLLLAPIILTVVVVVFGELTPKTLAVRAAEGYAMTMAPLLVAIDWVLRPLTYVLCLVPDLLARPLGRAPTALVTEGELRMLIGIGAEQGAVEETQGEMLQKVFEFGDRRAREVLTPSTEVIGIEEGTTLAEFLEVYSRHPHSRFPVYRENIDNVRGVLFIKDVLMAQAKGELAPTTPMHPLARPALFVPESKLVSELFDEMKAGLKQMAIVVDEFGGTAGIITMEQLLEAITGRLGDELVRVARRYQTIDEQTYELVGTMHVAEANEELHLGLPAGDYETVAGFVMDVLGHVPQEGESFAFDELKITVKQMVGPKIERVWITTLAKETS